jgi:glycosyltransferase involved in cell wall biosynthesis
VKKVLVLIRSLNIGGAEKQLLTLMKNIDRTRIEPVIVTFYSGGDLLPDFSECQTRVLSAQKSGRWDIFDFFSKLIKIIRSENPDVVLSYLVAANLLAVILKPLFRSARVIISIRHSFVRMEDYDRLNRILYSLESRLAGFSDRIIVNSFTGAKMAAQRGIPTDKMVVIPNGIDTDQFYPDKKSGRESRRQFGLSEKDRLVGIIGRLDPIKDHITLLEAASIVREQIPLFKLVIIGSGDGEYEQKLKTRVQLLGMEPNVIWIPSQNNLLGIYNMLDVCVSSSIGEGFSNVISEAMSCGIPCVATNVGDSAMIIEETGRIIPPCSVNEMAQAIRDLLVMSAKDRTNLGRKARERIMANFSVEKMVCATMTEIESLG